MSADSTSSDKQPNDLIRTEILKAVVADAESMGLRDKDKIELLTSRVIARLEHSRPLPGMEDLVPEQKRTQRRIPSRSEIQAIVKEILEADDNKSTDKKTPEIPVSEKAESEHMSESENKENKPMTEQVTRPGRKIRARKGLQLSENALRVLEKRYLQKDKQGNVIEKPEELFRRVAKAIAAAEKVYDQNADTTEIEEAFYRMMTSLEFLPNSPTLMNAGRDLGQLSACFVLPIEDSMESIFEAVKNTALIHKSGGGTGFSFTRLRPETDRVGSTGGVASGPISFMKAFDAATDVIKQGGMRRGANMAILSIDHPDIKKFITAKEDMTSLTNFNLSVAVTEEFMEAVKADSDFNLINPRTKEVQQTIKAKDLFDEIVDLAWKTGDPGIVFIDRINANNPTPHLGAIESTNPCGEQPLLPYESCNLGSINLSRMVKTTGDTTDIDYEKIAGIIRTAVRFLDNVIDVNKFPLEEIANMTRTTRKIGLGIMGFADMLIQLGIPYNTEEALKTADEVMNFVNEEAMKASAELAAERGTFPAYEGSVYDTAGGPKVRNATCTTIAPTGTLSIIAGCSSGIEPLFALSYIHNILDGANMVEVNPFFEKDAKDYGFYSEDLMKTLATGTSLHDIEAIPDDIRDVYVTAHDITPEWHVRMQAAFQKSTHNAVSKTVNFPETATREDIATVYMMAHEEKLKGITIYRDKSREYQPLSTAPVTKQEDPEPVVGLKISPRERPKVTNATVEEVMTGCGGIYVTVGSDELGICEVFLTLGKSGGCASAQLEAIGRLISVALRAGIDIESIIKQLRGIRCPSIAWSEGKSILSCSDAIATVLERHVNDDADTAVPVKTAGSIQQNLGLTRNIGGQCVECGSLLTYQEGCFVCHGCGYTKC